VRVSGVNELRRPIQLRKGNTVYPVVTLIFNAFLRTLRIDGVEIQGHPRPEQRDGPCGTTRGDGGG
jgi:hypothetical protein